MNRPALLPLALLAALAAPTGCLNLDTFVYNNVKVDEYEWEAKDPCDPDLLGELAVGAEEHGGPEATCHASLVPPESRVEGFVDAEGVQIHYVFAHRPDAVSTVLFSHGNRNHLGYYWDRAEILWEAGFNVLIYDYPGYGRSEGEPDEAGVYASAQAVADLLPSLPDVDLDRVFLYGYSLGGGPNYELALRGSDGELPFRPRGVASDAAWCNLDTMANEATQVGLDASYVLSQQFDNCKKIGELSPDIPVLINHGKKDGTVIFQNARFLRDAAVADDLTFHPIAAAAHHDMPLVESAYWGWLAEFFSR